MRIRFSLLSAAFLLCELAPAFAQGMPPAPAAPPCLEQGQVWDYQPVPGNRSLIVTDKFRKKFLVNFNGVCPELQWHFTLGFSTFEHTRLACLSRGDAVILRRTAGMPGDRCIIDSVQYYTPAMEHADAVNKAMDKPH